MSIVRNLPRPIEVHEDGRCYRYETSGCQLDCDELVPAANVSDQTSDMHPYGFRGEWQYVNLDSREPGDSWRGEQCSNCGCPGYTLTRVAGLVATEHGDDTGYRLRCSGDDTYDIEGCGEEYPVLLMQSHHVCF